MTCLENNAGICDLVLGFFGLRKSYPERCLSFKALSAGIPISLIPKTQEPLLIFRHSAEFKLLR
jgi:hypothetical protein